MEPSAKKIYFNNAATTPLLTRVRRKVLNCDVRGAFVPGAITESGRRADTILSEARKVVADMIGAKPEEIIFTSGGAESNAMAITTGMLMANSVLIAKNMGARDTVLIQATSHQSVISSAGNLRKHLWGAQYIIMPCDEKGFVEAPDVRRARKSVMMSVILTNNETGAVQDVREIAERCREQGVLLHVDAVQSFGKMETSVDKLGCDLMSISSHKIGGPAGVGALYVRGGVKAHPLIGGSDIQEFGIRGGTPNMEGIVGFMYACIYSKLDDKAGSVHMSMAGFMDGISDEVRSGSLIINTPSESWSGGILSVTVPGVDAEAFVLLLDEMGLEISPGAACHGGSKSPSHVLKSMGLSDEDALSTVRISTLPSQSLDSGYVAARIFLDGVKIMRDMASDEDAGGSVG